MVKHTFLGPFFAITCLVAVLVKHFSTVLVQLKSIFCAKLCGIACLQIALVSEMGSLHLLIAKFFATQNIGGSKELVVLL